MAEAPSVLRAVSPDSVVLSLVGLLEDDGREASRKKSFRLLSEHSTAPVYGLWETALGTGIVGGRIAGGFHQGEAAAQIARRILQGEPVSNIPVLLKSPNIPMFDWNALKRFGIREKDLPSGSQVLFRPFSLYDRYRIWFWIIPGFIAIESWLLFTLLVSRRRRAEATRALTESEENFKDLYEEAPVGYMEYDTKGLITRVNRRELEMLGYTEEEMVGKPVWYFDMEKEEAQELTKAKLMGDGEPRKNLERTYIRKNGTTFPSLIEDVVLRDKTGRIVGIRSTIQDITDLDMDLLNMSGSSVHIRKVIMNLVSNASEAVEGSGNVIISTMNRYVDRPVSGYEDVSKGEYAVLTVSDDGLGILSDDLERIFEPFFSKKVMGRSGTGLGLAVVWNIVQDHEGYIDVSSDEDGTTFEIYFPITRDELTEKDRFISMEDYRGKGETILVVDDVESQRAITCNMLDALGYKSNAVSSGEEAVEYLKEHRVDLILLDMIMDPGINGRETYKRITKILPNQKAVIVSGFAETDEVKETQRLGAGKYVKKPLRLQEIGLAIKEELEKS